MTVLLIFHVDYCIIGKSGKEKEYVPLLPFLCLKFVQAFQYSGNNEHSQPILMLLHHVSLLYERKSWFLPFGSLMWWIILTHFLLLDHPCTPGKTGLWYCLLNILLIWVPVILFRISALWTTLIAIQRLCSMTTCYFSSLSAGTESYALCWVLGYSNG